MSKIHLFGEMDLALSVGAPAGAIYDKAFKIAEMCGYFIDLHGKSQIQLYGSDGEIAVLSFNEHGLYKVHVYQKNDEGDIISPVKEVKI